MTKTTIKLAIATWLAAASVSAFAQAWPERPVKVIIPFPPGGTLDKVGRMLALKLGEWLLRLRWGRL